MTGFLRCCWFYVSTDSVCFSKFVICCPCFCLGRFAISHALRYRVLAICCQPRRSPTSGSRNHRAALYCRQAAFHCNRSTEIHFGGSAPLHRCLRFALDIVRSQPRTASLLSGNSVLRAGFGSGRSTLPRLVSVFQRFCAEHARGEPSVELPAARVRRTVADYASTCKSASVCPSMAFSGVRLIRERVGILVL